MKVRRTILKNRLNKTVAALATGALLLVAVPVAGFASAGAATKPVYVIGYEGPLTGSANQYGLNELGGLQLAVNQWNAISTLPFTLDIKQFDDQGSGSLSPAQAAAAVAVPNLVAVVGPAFSGATHAAQPAYLAASMPIITPSATAVGLATGGNFFRMVYGDDVQGSADANFLINVKKAKSITVINDGTFYGAGVAQVVSDFAKKVKGETVKLATLPQTSSCSGGIASVAQFAAEATVIKHNNPAAVFYGGYACDFANLLPALAKVGYKGLVMSGDGSYDAALMTQTTPISAAKGAYLSAANCGSASNLTGADAAAYEALTGIAPAAALYDAQAYDAGNIVVTALKSLSASLATNTITQTRSAIVSYLHANSFEGVTGKIAFQANGNLVGSGKGNIAIYQITGKDLPTKHACY